MDSVLFVFPFTSAQDPKKKKRLEKLSKGPAFMAHRATCHKKMLEKAQSLQKQMQAVNEKLDESRKKATGEDQPKDDSILLSYLCNVDVALGVVTAWQAPVNLDACPAPAFQSEQDPLLPSDWGKFDLPAPLEDAQKAMREIVRSPKTSVNLVQDVSQLKTLQYFEWTRKALMECSCIHMVEAIVKAEKDDVSCVEQLIRSLGRVASDLKSYLAQLARQSEQAAAKKKKAAEKEEIAKATALAKAQASKIKKGKTGGSNIPDIFLVPASEWAPMKERASHDEAMDEEAWDSPWVLHGSAVVATWKGSQLMALKLSEFAAGYKKADSFKKEGRAQAAVMPKSGKEECHVMFQKLMDEKILLDISKVAGGENFMSNIWRWGMDSKLTGAWLSPNVAAQIKVVAMGAVTVIAFELKDLMPVVGADATCDALTKFVLSLTRDSPHWSSVRGFRAELKADSAIYLPQGWMVAEMASENVLIHGVRKSFLVNRANAKANYQSAVSLLKRSNRDPSKMEAVLGCYV